MLKNGLTLLKSIKSTFYKTYRSIYSASGNLHKIEISRLK